MIERRSLTTLVIDALDECDRKEREHLLDALSKMIKDSKGLVKICVSCRDDLDIDYHLEGCPNLEVAANKNHDDIVTFVHTELGRQIERKPWLYGKVPGVLRDEIKIITLRPGMRYVSSQLFLEIREYSSDTIKGFDGSAYNSNISAASKWPPL